MRMPDRCGPATRSLQSEALRAHPPQALGGGLRGQRLAKLDARAEGGAVVDSREAPPTWADSAVGDHDDRGDSTNHRKLAEHNLSLPLASYARRYTRRTCRQWPEISTDDNILHRNKVDNIPHRCRDYNILHRNRVDNIPHSNMDIHSTHAYRLDDRPAERADGRVHNSTVHNLVELVWSPSSHSTVLRSWMGTLSQRRQR
jgi:hypothetical protein